MKRYWLPKWILILTLALISSSAGCVSFITVTPSTPGGTTTTSIAGLSTLAYTPVPSPFATPTPILPHVRTAMGAKLPPLPTFVSPVFINHSAPELAVDFGPFNKAGCSPLSIGGLRCEIDSPMGALGCYEIRSPPSLLGALDPPYPIALCITPDCKIANESDVEHANWYYYSYYPGGEYFFINRGWCDLVRYLVFKDDSYILIETEDEFRFMFAPIDTEEEALSYVLAVTGLKAYYGLERDHTNTYFVPQIEDTHVTTVSTGEYVVHLFQSASIGCGPHPVLVVDLRVTSDGTITLLYRSIVYQDQRMEGGCND